MANGQSDHKPAKNWHVLGIVAELVRLLFAPVLHQRRTKPAKSGRVLNCAPLFPRNQGSLSQKSSILDESH
jgi:hypothetical protein